jgi:hypothetical protein
MLKLALLGLWVGVCATEAADQFALQIASPVAGQGANLKSSAFVFRSTGCPDAGKVLVTAKAEGKVQGQRRTLTLKTTPAAAPGTFGVFREWPQEGVWIVNVAAKCGTESAGTLVVLAERGGPNREASKFFSHAPTDSEVEAVLNSAVAGK